MPAGLAIERANQNDIEAVLELDGHPVHRAALTKSIASGDCWIARIGTTAVGFAVADESFFGQCFIWALSVDERHRRTGIATSLIGAIECTFGDRKLFTSTNESNTPAQRLFDSLGFDRSGVIENLDEGDPEIVYFKRSA